MGLFSIFFQSTLSFHYLDQNLSILGLHCQTAHCYRIGLHCWFLPDQPSLLTHLNSQSLSPLNLPAVTPMSTILNTASNPTAAAFDFSSNGSIGELQNMNSSYPLCWEELPKKVPNCQNLGVTPQDIKSFVGSGPSLDDPKFAAWDEEDSITMSWLWNSRQPKSTAIWYSCQVQTSYGTVFSRTYTLKKGLAVVYELETKISSTKQSSMSVQDYYNLKNGGRRWITTMILRWRAVTTWR